MSKLSYLSIISIFFFYFYFVLVASRGILLLPVYFSRSCCFYSRRFLRYQYSYLEIIGEYKCLSRYFFIFNFYRSQINLRSSYFQLFQTVRVRISDEERLWAGCLDDGGWYCLKIGRPSQLIFARKSWMLSTPIN